MVEPGNIAGVTVNKEAHRIIGEVQLQQYGKFLEKHNTRLHTFNSKLLNPNHVSSSIVGLENNFFEDVPLIQLVQCDNKLLSRILASLAAVCEELRLLSSEASQNYFNQFLFYEESLLTDNKGAPPISMLMDKFQSVTFFIDRCQQVILLLLHQICAISGENLNTVVSSFPEPIDCLAELLVCLITLDAICGNTFKRHWTAYHKNIRSMLHNPSKFNVSLNDIRLLEKRIDDIGQKVLGGNIFERTLEKCLDEGLVVTMKNSTLNNEFNMYINQILSELEKDYDYILFTQLWLQVNVMFVFNYTCFANMDKKIFKRLLDINKKVSTCTIIGNILWNPEKFLIKYIPGLAHNLDLKAVSNNRLILITYKTQNLSRQAHLMCAKAYNWIIEIMSAIKQDLSKLKVKQLQHYAEVFVEGIKLVKNISDVIKWITNVHVDAGKPMAKSVLLTLCKLIKVVKAAQSIFDKNLVQLIYIIVLICQLITHKALTILINVKKTLTQEKFYREQQLDVLSALAVAECALKGPTTRQRILVIKLALSASGLPNDTLSEIRTVINHLEIIYTIPTLMHKYANCSFIYWHQVILPVYFSKLVDTKLDLSRFYLFMNCLNDCINIVENNFEELIEGHFKKNIMLPLNQSIETNLRLQTHLHLQLPPSDPFQSSLFKSFKNLFPVQFSDKYFSIKEEIEHYLSTMFYNLITVVLHDWRIYGEMRSLAVLQYGLNTIEDGLPTQTLEQGIDVLEIMRNIHIFVGKYLYNLNNQFFVEETSNNKHLNTINISHIANSIRTHGIGIMNTAINFTYQFLQNQFYIFSQFMFDEQIKSRLLKDHRFFVDHKIELNEMYPYERAEKFNFAIRKLGLNTEGLSFLDLFRKLITHIGNAMGYIRMIRSGGRRCLSNATCFLPDLQAVQQLKDILEIERVPDIIKNAILCFLHDSNTLVENFEEATEYFQLLINVFIPAFRNPDNVHLRNFFVIVPPLTINFVEHILICKERLTKKNKDGAAFTDDGFAIGLAYIIELLHQNLELNSLHWFQSVTTKYTKERKNLEQQKVVASKEDYKLQQTLALSEKRLNAIEKEFQLLFYNFNSARIFFQA